MAQERIGRRCGDGGRMEGGWREERRRLFGGGGGGGGGKSPHQIGCTTDHVTIFYSIRIR